MKFSGIIIPHKMQSTEDGIICFKWPIVTRFQFAGALVSFLHDFSRDVIFISMPFFVAPVSYQQLFHRKQ